MRILLLGVEGQLGTELRRTVPPDAELIAPRQAEADFTRLQELRALVRAARPQAILNAAAYTAVDRAESESALAHTINAEAPALLAEEATRHGAAIIHYSTDYVYGGDRAAPWTEGDVPAPCNVYGATKLAGDLAVLGAGARGVVLRTSWVYAAHGQNFVRTMLRLGRERDELRVVADQRGCPTWAHDLARASWTVLGRGCTPGGLFHCAGAGAVSWHGFAERIFALARQRPLGADLRVRSVVPIATADYPTPARRPLQSELDCSRIAREHGVRMPEWADALARCLDELGAAAPGPPC